MTPVLGSTLAYLVDLAIPALAVAVLIVLNRRERTSDQAEQRFWTWTGSYAGFLVLWAVIALVFSFQLVGEPTIVAVLVSLPLSALPSLFNSNVIHFFFAPSQWAGGGYYFVMVVFLLGLVQWALLVPLGIRRWVQHMTSRAR